MSFVDATCCNCGGDGLEATYDAPGFDSARERYTLARCRHCSLTSTQRITPPLLADAYASDYYGGGDSKFAGPIESVVRAFAARRAAKLVRRWRGGGGTGTPRVLDIGCGRGTLLAAFRALGAEVLGIERDSFPVPEELVGCVDSAELGDARFDGEQFDIIVIWHVLEHIQAVDRLINEAARHLERRGLLVIAVPNFDSFQQRAFGANWFHLDLPRHVTHIGSTWLRGRVSAAGLDIESASHVDLLQNMYGFIQSVMNAVAPNHPNEFYQLLKAGASTSPLRLIGWMLLAGLIAPVSAVETLLGAVSGRGATVALLARQR